MRDTEVTIERDRTSTGFNIVLNGMELTMPWSVAMQAALHAAQVLRGHQVGRIRLIHKDGQWTIE